jgi:hypothetical protein
MTWPQFRKQVVWQISILAAGMAGPVWGQTAQSAVDLVRKTAASELAAAHSDDAKFMFRDRKQTPHGSQTKLMVETRDAMAGMLIATDDKPLNQQEREAETARLDRFLKDPDELVKRQRQEKEEDERVERIMKALPEAFLYDYAGAEPGRTGMGAPGRSLTKLAFRPNPAYSPPTHVEQVLTGMKGWLLIDSEKYRIARIDGTLEKEVSFGWGILGHLDPGGHFLVEQGDVGDGHWEISRMDLAMTGKILLFKSISFTQTEVENDFHEVPSNLTFAQGLELLRKHEALLAENTASHR